VFNLAYHGLKANTGYSVKPFNLFPTNLLRDITSIFYCPRTQISSQEVAINIEKTLNQEREVVNVFPKI
jgi:hypothetical protein